MTTSFEELDQEHGTEPGRASLKQGQTLRDLEAT